MQAGGPVRAFFAPRVKVNQTPAQVRGGPPIARRPCSARRGPAARGRSRAAARSAAPSQSRSSSRTWMSSPANGSSSSPIASAATQRVADANLGGVDVALAPLAGCRSRSDRAVVLFLALAKRERPPRARGRPGLRCAGAKTRRGVRDGLLLRQEGRLMPAVARRCGRASAVWRSAFCWRARTLLGVACRRISAADCSRCGRRRCRAIALLEVGTLVRSGRRAARPSARSRCRAGPQLRPPALARRLSSSSPLAGARTTGAAPRGTRAASCHLRASDACARRNRRTSGVSKLELLACALSTASCARSRSSKCAIEAAMRSSTSKGSSMWLRTKSVRLPTDFIETVWWNRSSAWSFSMPKRRRKAGAVGRERCRTLRTSAARELLAQRGDVAAEAGEVARRSTARWSATTKGARADPAAPSSRTPGPASRAWPKPSLKKRAENAPSS